MTPIPISAPGSPRFSIVTVTYNNRVGLEETRRSVLEQSFAGYEWIVIDGASKDGTPDLLARESDERLSYVSEPDGGIYDAMNKGLDRACGDYVVFLNAGDRFADRDVLAELDAHIGAKKPVVVYGDSIEFDETKSFYKAARQPSENRLVMFTHHQAILYRTDVAQAHRYDLSYKISCDWVMTTRILRSGGERLRFTKPICLFERGGVSQRQDYRRAINQELFRIYRTEQGFGLATAALLWLRKVAINKARQLLPGLYDRLRYPRGRGESLHQGGAGA